MLDFFRTSLLMIYQFCLTKLPGSCWTPKSFKEGHADLSQRTKFGMPAIVQVLLNDIRYNSNLKISKTSLRELLSTSSKFFLWKAPRSLDRINEIANKTDNSTPAFAAFTGWHLDYFIYLEIWTRTNSVCFAFCIVRSSFDIDFAKALHSLDQESDSKELTQPNVFDTHAMAGWSNSQKHSIKNNFNCKEQLSCWIKSN